jgi:hypothetical protein
VKKKIDMVVVLMVVVVTVRVQLYPFLLGWRKKDSTLDNTRRAAKREVCEVIKYSCKRRKKGWYGQCIRDVSGDKIQ